MGTFPYRRPKTSNKNSKENIDKREDGQIISGSIILNAIHEYKRWYISKKVTFDTWDDLEVKIDRLTSMTNKLTTQDDSQNKQIKPKIYQRE